MDTNRNLDSADIGSAGLPNDTETATKSRRKYTAGEFEGPLDLLWTLIRESKVNIYDIPIAQITEQYLEYLDFAVQTDLSDLSEFYSWAAKLIYIKSRMLLPIEITGDDEDIEDPRQELVAKLIEYQKFKKLSVLMEEKEEAGEWSFERKKFQCVLPFEEEESQWKKVDTWDLLQQMQKIFHDMVAVYSNEKIINMYEEVSINEKITLISELLDNKGEFMFTELIVRRGNEMDIICAFMAILEAVKFKMASIYQNKLFGDIKICRYKVA
ncbi:segregation/condensation protein A [Treponema parvum]|uniref:Segregation and condensation protein A n=1 Tax=Treponema parvum TaxID=138851 RepID=A0A975F4Y2_9SPIR|nr:ScpA family protein [Treponema parvum]QTQ14496.1 segregation/condensation protein A [Treponema parvum]